MFSGVCIGVAWGVTPFDIMAPLAVGIAAPGPGPAPAAAAAAAAAGPFGVGG